MLDRVTTVDLVAKAIDKVFSFNGRIKGKLVYFPDDLIKIGESMARRAADPARFTCQGFHTTSVIQSKMRQLLETDPVEVIEPIAQAVTTGACELRSLDGKNSYLVEVDFESLALDMESRLCDEQSITRKGFRDAAGQIYDLLVMQAFLNQKSTEEHTYTFRQRVSANSQTTGEVVLKGFRGLSGREDTVNEGTALTIKDAWTISMLTEGRCDGLVVDSSLTDDPSLNPISSQAELVERTVSYHKATARPIQAAVHINSLLNPDEPGNGHDLHMISAIYDQNSKLFFCQSHWGLLTDSLLNGLSAEELYKAMIFQGRVGGEPEAYDRLSPKERHFDAVFPLKPRDWSKQLLSLRKESAWLEQVERRSLSSSRGLAMTKYREDYRLWHDARAQHLELFGESMPFSKPEPEKTF